MKKVSGFCQRLFGVPEPQCVPVIPQPASETDLVDTEQSSVPVPRVSEQDPQVDLVDPEESSVPGLNRSEPEPVSSEGQAVEVRDAISDLKSPTLVCDDLSVSAGPSERDEQLENEVKRVFSVLVSPTEVAGSSSGIDASPETPENSPTDEQLENEVKHVFSVLVSPTEVAGSSSGIDEPESCVPGPSVPELKPELDLVGSDESCVPGPSVPELEPELDLVGSDESYESCVPGPSVPELEPELDLVGSDESCVPGPSVPEQEPELDLVGSDESCTSEQELVQEETCFPPVTAVWDNIFIGNEEIARDRMKMKELGITHILNAAAVKKLRFPWEKDPRKETVNTGASYYRGMNITYCGLPTTHSSKISKYFVSAAKFIHKAKKNPKNKVFIHCTEGVSYAPTLFLAYLMIHHYMTLEDAIDHLIEVRYIKPDIDFLKQLEILNEELVHKNNSWK
ncbi:hypothetical protein PO909_014344 [Leuciscus waleckii]